MSIPVKCPACSHMYSVKEELAGKKFQCKSCQAIVAIPRAKEAGPFEDLADDPDDDLPPVPRPKRKRKSRDQAGTKAAKIVMIVALVLVGGVAISALIGVGIYGGILAIQSLPKGWVEVTSPDKRVTVRMPVEPEKFTHPFGVSQGFRYSLKHEDQQFVFKDWRLPSHVARKSDDEIMEEHYKALTASKDWTNVQRTTIADRPAISFETSSAGWNFQYMDFLDGDKAYTLVYGYKDVEQPQVKDKFFKSLKISQ